MQALVTDPDAFFENKSRSGRLRVPTLIVLLAGFALALQSIAVFLALEDGIRVNNALTVEGMLAIIEAVLFWLAVTVVFYVLARIFTSRIQIGRLFRLVGWGFFPFLFAGIIWAIGRYVVFQGKSVPEWVTLGQLAAEQEGYGELFAEVAGDPVLVGTAVAGSLFVLLSGYLWSYAILHSSNIGKRKAQVIGFLPAIAYVVWNVYTVL